MRGRWPRVLRVSRADPLRLTCGDEAVADFGPGLLQFLNLRDRRDVRIGEGSAPEWVIPIAAGGTAAYGVADPGGRAELNWWTGKSNDVRLYRASTENETLLATSTPEKMGRTSVRRSYRVVSRGQREPGAAGAFVFLSAGAGAPRRAEMVVVWWLGERRGAGSRGVGWSGAEDEAKWGARQVRHRVAAG